MVELQLSDGYLDVDVVGLHRLLALKGRIRVPRDAIAATRRMRPDEIEGWWKGWRVPGTHLPGVIVAGTYYRHGERHFWDVRDAERAIEIELRGQRYDRLFVEVDDPDQALRRLGGGG